MTKINKNTWIASFGSALEYFDFVVYGLLSKYLNSAFFPNASTFKSTFYTLFIFALGYIVRPLGGTIAGIIGDIYGRRRVFLFLTGLMCTSTLTIGILPSYASWGCTSTVLLIICRVLQGISFGGEISGATTIIGESSSEDNRSLNTSFMISGTAIGALLATAALYLLTQYMSQDAIMDWGWRIPFFGGGVLGIVLWVLRKSVTETLVLNRATFKYSNSFTNTISLIKTHTKYIILSMMLCTFTSSLIVINIFYPVFINGYYGIEISKIYKAITISLVMSCFFCPFFGWLLKYISKYNLLISTYISYLCFSIILFTSLKNTGEIYLIYFMVLHQLFLSLCYVCHISIKYDLFPMQMRYTGLAFSANIISAVMGLLPMGLTSLKNVYNNPLHMPLVMMALCCVSLIAVLMILKLRKHNMEK